MAAPMEEEKNMESQISAHKTENARKVTMSGDLLDSKQHKGSILEIRKSTKKGEGALTTFKVPESSVLSRVQAFLPQMAHADTELNEKLKGCSPEALNIENIDDHDGPVIEMNLALVETQSSDSESELSLDSTSESSDSESDTDSVKQDPNYGPVTCKNIKIPGTRTTSKHSPKIEVLDSKDKHEVDNKNQSPEGK